MSHPLLDRNVIDQDIEQYLRSAGDIFTEFGDLTRDSGNISYGLRIGEQRFFVKTAGHPDDPKPMLNHADRVALLRNAIQRNRAVNYSALPKLNNVIESPAGPLLVYEWMEGELPGTPAKYREDSACAFQRFRRLPTSTILKFLDSIFELHERIAEAGWIALDFYDGCLIYNFLPDNLIVMDLDMYRQGPFHNEIGRMFGSTRFMAPEEFELGALIDQQTNVFTMGRTALVFLSDGTLNSDAFSGSRSLFEVIARACDPDRSQRYESLAAFCRAWQDARFL